MKSNLLVMVALAVVSMNAQAVPGGVYVHESDDGRVFEARVTDEGHGEQFMRVFQVEPPLKQQVITYTLEVEGAHSGGFDFGKLLASGRGKPNDLGLLVAFDKPISMKLLLNLTNSEGETFRFQFDHGR